LKNLASIFSFINPVTLKSLKKNKIPQHVAIIMDGNGRWASKRKLPRIFGHSKGAEVLRETVITCKELGIKYLTAFAFSSENWQRPQPEVNDLMRLFVDVLDRELPGMIKDKVRLNLIGNREIIPPDILAVFVNAEEKTRDNNVIVLNIAFSYGARDEIYQAARKFCSDTIKGKIYPGKGGIEDINIFSGYLFTSGIPDPDLLIRTSGEYRISNFLLWQIAYTELYFTRVLWPDFDRKCFYRAIFDYQKRERRFGKL